MEPARSTLCECGFQSEAGLLAKAAQKPHEKFHLSSRSHLASFEQSPMSLPGRN